MMSLFFLMVAAVNALAAHSFTHRLEEADRSFKERAQRDKAYDALERYRELQRERPSSAEIGWRLAMACQMVGHRLTIDKHEKAALFAEGRDAALSALKADRQCGPCHFWAGINMALYGEAVGVIKILSSLKTVQHHLKEAARHDPSYAFAGPYRVLGLIEQRLPGVLGGSNARAKEHFEKAIAASPESPLNYLFLSRLLLDNLKDPKLALEVAGQGLKKPKPPTHEIESIEARRELEALHSRLQKKAN